MHSDFAIDLGQVSKIMSGVTRYQMQNMIHMIEAIKSERSALKS